MKNQDTFTTVILKINKNVIRFLIGMMTFSLILGSAHLIYLVVQKAIDPTPFFLLLDVSDLLSIFNLVLIIAVGYELIKSLVLIITSEEIPTVPIVQIAIVAVANKIITLDLKHSDPNMIIGLALLISALGLAHFLLKYKKCEK
ncbi:hypothetical protein C3L50_07635 [Flavobacterium alvei]|uniref:Phosphate-starvation-inducible E-like protein n=1 Tax=Flavobacterium alvei TaxID=2080416 RepID=A0A2S5ABN6_9FLAO|nr:phosphate-starvation-inducible PsiE family protein [Flavobacterium alvei]POY39699.1 hypothetical protein C3L50_07635 [Flavobacterium alvei]